MLLSAFFCPTLVCGTAFVINFIAIYYHASRAIPLTIMVSFSPYTLTFWFAVAVCVFALCCVLHTVPSTDGYSGLISTKKAVQLNFLLKFQWWRNFHKITHPILSIFYPTNSVWFGFGFYS